MMNRERKGRHNSKTIDIVLDGSLFSARVGRKKERISGGRQKNIMIIVNQTGN